MESKFKIPTETVELPSKGLLYTEDSPLSKGVIELKYMTAKEEDILTNTNYMKNGTVIDKLLQSLIVTEGVDYNDLLIGDKNAIMVAARVLAYGKDYEIEYNGEKLTVDLSALESKELDESLYTRGQNEFELSLEQTGNVITFKLLTQGDENAIDQEIRGLKKIRKDVSTDVTTRLKHMILSVNGDRTQATIRDFVENAFLARDAREFRKYYSKISPDVNLVFSYKDEYGVEEDVDIPVGLNFFWPDA